MIPQSFIQDLLARTDIVEVVGRVVKLKKSGSNWHGLCPFHNEKSPSFTVSASKQFYHCFGCGAHGSAIGFLMEQGGLSYVEAIHDLAGQLGLSVPQEPRQGPGGGWRPRPPAPAPTSPRDEAPPGPPPDFEAAGIFAGDPDFDAEVDIEAIPAGFDERPDEDGLPPAPPGSDGGSEEGEQAPWPPASSAASAPSARSSPSPGYPGAARVGAEGGAQRGNQRRSQGRSQASGAGLVHGPGDGTVQGGGESPRPPRLDRAAEQRLFTLLQRAADHYRARLRESPRAIDYLKARGLSGKAAAHFSLGYAPPGWRGLEALAAPAAPPASTAPPGSTTSSRPAPAKADAEGFDYADPALVDAGLVIRSDEGKRYDRFRDRIVFPIRDARGRVVGFGGRVIDQGEPKYLNSPETPVFIKGRELYGLFEARQAMRQKNEVLVVEGYMDVVMLHQQGIGQVVAALGTATTEEHVVKLARLVDRVVFAFDGDAAGRRAASRALLTVLPRVSDNRRFDFLFLPPEHDPDSYIRAHGLAAFEQQLAEAMPLSAFVLREVGNDFDSAEDRAQALSRFKPMVLAMPDSAIRVQLIHAVAERVGFTLADLLAYLGLQPPRPVPSEGWRERRPWQGDRPGGWQGGQGGSRAGQFGGGGAGQGGGSGGDRAGRPGSERGDRGDRRFGGGRGPGRGPGEGVTGIGGAVPVPLTARICGLLAMHPELAAIVVNDDPLTPPLRQWRERVRQLPEGADLAAVVEALRETLAREADALLRSGHDRLRVIGALTFDQARAEYLGALQRLEIGQVEAERKALLKRGVETAEERARYKWLRSREAELKALADPDNLADDRGAGQSGVLDI